MSESEARRLLAEQALRFDATRQEFPNAERHLRGGLFISHAGLDYRRILDEIVYPVVYDRFRPDGYFLHNRTSGGAGAYVRLVHLALRLCDKVAVVVSANSVHHEWVAAEADWAIAHNRIVICCLLDGSDPASIHRALAAEDGDALAVRTVDFRSNLDEGRETLVRVLDAILADRPYQASM